jgi:hypothetical protein
MVLFAGVGLRSHGGVAHGHIRLRDLQRQLPRRLVGRLVETGKRIPRVGGFELREQVAVAAVLRAEDAGAVALADGPGVVDVDFGRSRRNRSIQFQPQEIVAAVHGLGFQRVPAGGHGLERSDGSVSVFRTAVLPHEGDNVAVNHRYVERLLKFLLWQKGGYRVTIAGDAAHRRLPARVYSPEGARAFDYQFMGERVYGRPMAIESVRV